MLCSMSARLARAPAAPICSQASGSCAPSRISVAAACVRVSGGSSLPRSEAYALAFQRQTGGVAGSALLSGLPLLPSKLRRQQDRLAHRVSWTIVCACLNMSHSDSPGTRLQPRLESIHRRSESARVGEEAGEHGDGVAVQHGGAAGGVRRQLPQHPCQVAAAALHSRKDDVL